MIDSRLFRTRVLLVACLLGLLFAGSSRLPAQGITDVDYRFQLIDTFGQTVGRWSAMAVTADGRPMIAYYGSPGLEGGSELRFAWWDGLLWRTDVADASPGAGRDVSMALDSNGYPQLCHATLEGLKYTFWDGAQWQSELVEAGSSIGMNCSLALDPRDQARVGYDWEYSVGDGITKTRVKYAWRDGPNDWKTEIVASPEYNHWDPSLAIDTSGVVHLTYTAERAQGFQIIVYQVRSGTVWNAVGGPSDNDMANAALAVDATGQPHLVYRRSGAMLSYSTRVDDRWTTPNTVSRYSGPPSLALDAAGQPRVAYDFPPTGAIHYAQLTRGSWNIQEFINDGALNASLALWNDEPFISFYKRTGPHILTSGVVGDLYLISRNANWRVNAVEADVSRFTSLAFAKGVPHVAYSLGRGSRMGLNHASWTAAPTPFGQGSWTTSDPPVAPAFEVPNQPSLAIAERAATRDVDLGIASVDFMEGDLNYSTVTGSLWQTDTVDGPPGDAREPRVGHFPNLIIDAWTEPTSVTAIQHVNRFITYWDDTNYAVRHASQALGDSEWQVSTGPLVSLPAFDSESGHLSSALVYEGRNFGTRPVLYTAVYDHAQGDLWLINNDGERPYAALVDDGGSNDVGQFCSLAVEERGERGTHEFSRLFSVAYYDASSHALKYAEKSSSATSWTIVTVLIDPDRELVDLELSQAGGVTRIAFSSWDNAGLTYTGTLNVATRHPEAGWAFETIDSQLFDRFRDLSFGGANHRLYLSCTRAGTDNPVLYHSTFSATAPPYNAGAPCNNDRRPASVAESSAKRKPAGGKSLDAAERDDLTILRALRDHFVETPGGRRLIDLYYTHAAESRSLHLSDPELMWNSFRTIQAFLPGFSMLARRKGDRAVISQDMVELAQETFNTMRDAGTPELKAVIDTELGKHNNLDDFIGLTFDEWFQAVINPSAKAPRANMWILY